MRAAHSAMRLHPKEALIKSILGSDQLAAGEARLSNGSIFKL
jgi:hypothetical protein